MQLLDDSMVEAREIDDLGHLNVRHYMRRVLRANGTLLGGFGLDLGDDARLLVRADSYSRFRHEQFAGARLGVRGGVLAAAADGIDTVYEIVNLDDGALAANFLIRFALKNAATRAAADFSSTLVDRARAAAIALPEDRGPRSLTLDAIDPEAERAAAAGIAADAERQAARIIDREVYPEDADAHGFLGEEEELLYSRSRHGDMPPAAVIGAQIVSERGDVRLAWPMLEMRLVNVARPRAGDVITTIAADVAIGAKTRQMRRWTINRGDGALIAVQDTMSIAVDLNQRRAIEIPADIRANLERRCIARAA